MEPDEIVKDLHRTPYKFTLANHLRSELKKLSEGEFEYVSRGLRRLLRKNENTNLAKPVETILS
jgi:hypothetical protein